MKNLPVLNLLVFTCFLVMGYTFSLRFYQAEELILPVSVHEGTLADQLAIKTLQNGQRSILLISASSLDTLTPHLESIWLATYLSTDTTIQLLPIYPTGSQHGSDFESQVNRSFKLNKLNERLVLDQMFVSLLKDSNYWWSGYIIFDETLLIRLFNLVGGIQLDGQTLDGSQVISGIWNEAANTQHAYSSQIAILQSLCHEFAGGSPNPDLSQLTSLVPNHILTDLDPSQLKMELDTLYSGNHNPTCRFPTLEISRIEP